MNRMSIESLENREMMTANPVAEAPVVPEPEVQAGFVFEVETDGAQELMDPPGWKEGVAAFMSGLSAQILDKLMARFGGQDLGGDKFIGTQSLDKLMARIGGTGSCPSSNLMARIGDCGQDGECFSIKPVTGEVGDKMALTDNLRWSVLLGGQEGEEVVNDGDCGLDGDGIGWARRGLIGVFPSRSVIDTDSTIPISQIFTDGFESGNVADWPS